jgi:hypothetical protein
VEVREVAERAAGERDRVPAAVVVPAHGERGVAAAGEQRAHRLPRHSGLVAEQQHEHVGPLVHDVERRRDRRRAPGAVGVVDHHPSVAQVDSVADLVGAAADHHHELVEVARARGLHDVPEQGPVAVRQQLLRAAQPLRAAGAQD